MLNKTVASMCNRHVCECDGFIYYLDQEFIIRKIPVIDKDTVKFRYPDVETDALDYILSFDVANILAYNFVDEDVSDILNRVLSQDSPYITMQLVLGMLRKNSGLPKAQIVHYTFEGLVCTVYVADKVDNTTVTLFATDETTKVTFTQTCGRAIKRVGDILSGYNKETTQDRYVVACYFKQHSDKFSTLNLVQIKAKLQCMLDTSDIVKPYIYKVDSINTVSSPDTVTDVGFSYLHVFVSCINYDKTYSELCELFNLHRQSVCSIVLGMLEQYKPFMKLGLPINAYHLSNITLTRQFFLTLVFEVKTV